MASNNTRDYVDRCTGRGAIAVSVESTTDRFRYAGVDAWVRVRPRTGSCTVGRVDRPGDPITATPDVPLWLWVDGELDITTTASVVVELQYAGADRRAGNGCGS